MKINYKKIATVLGSVLMVGSTMGLAAAANFPAPFSSGDVAIVTGSMGADTMDLTSATTIAGSISTSSTLGAITTGIIAGGDSVQLQRGTNKFNYGDALNTHYTSMDNEEFALVLADGTYLNDDNTEYDYEQTIAMSSEAIQFFQDSKFNDKKPVIGFDFARGDHVLNYTLDFSPENAEGGSAVSSDEYPKLDNTNIEILGKDYFVSNAEFTSNGIQLTLLDAANTATIAEGETKTLTIGGKTYIVQIDFVESTTTARLIVNGDTTNSIDEGESYKLKDGTYLGLKDVSYSAKDSGISKVEFSLGTGKLVLEEGQEVEINDEAVSEFEDANGYSSIIKAYFTNTTATNIDKMVLEWKVNTETWVAPGTELTMPGFNAIKLAMTSWNMPEQEITTLEDDGNSIRLSTQIKDGDLDLDLLYSNTAVTLYEGLGEDSTHKLVTNVTVDPKFKLNESEDSYFVATWISGDEAESYAYELGGIASNSGKNETTLKNLVAGGRDLVFDTAGDTEDVGQITFTLKSADDTTGVATIQASGAEVYGNLLTTVEGLTMRLPVATAAVNYTAVPLTDGQFPTNASAQGYAATTWTMNFTEEDKDGNIYTGSSTVTSFTATLGIVSGEGTEPTGTSLTEIDEEDNSDYSIAYVASDLATKVRLYNPSSSSSLNKLEIIYAGAESYANVYVAETSATAGTSDPTTAIQPILDTDTAAMAGKNLIIVGGSCVNKVAAQLLALGNPTSVSSCLAAFTTKTNVAAGQFVIQSFDAVAAGGTAGKVALLVAGYTKEDTQKASTYLVNKVPATTIGKKYRGTSTTEASLV